MSPSIAVETAETAYGPDQPPRCEARAKAAQEAGLFQEAAGHSGKALLNSAPVNIFAAKVDAFRNCVSLVAMVAPSSESDPLREFDFGRTQQLLETHGYAWLAVRVPFSRKV